MSDFDVGVSKKMFQDSLKFKLKLQSYILNVIKTSCVYSALLNPRSYYRITNFTYAINQYVVKTNFKFIGQDGDNKTEVFSFELFHTKESKRGFFKSTITKCLIREYVHYSEEAKSLDYFRCGKLTDQYLAIDDIPEINNFLESIKSITDTVESYMAI